MTLLIPFFIAGFPRIPAQLWIGRLIVRSCPEVAGLVAEGSLAVPVMETGRFADAPPVSTPERVAPLRVGAAFRAAKCHPGPWLEPLRGWGRRWQRASRDGRRSIFGCSDGGRSGSFVGAGILITTLPAGKMDPLPRHGEVPVLRMRPRPLSVLTNFASSPLGVIEYGARPYSHRSLARWHDRVFNQKTEALALASVFHGVAAARPGGRTATCPRHGRMGSAEPRRLP